MSELGTDSMVFFQVFDMVDIGLVILDKDLRVCHWNRWMQLHSGIPTDKIVGALIFDTFPQLKRPRFLRSCKTVLTFGNFCFFSQKLHHYLFPFKPISSFDAEFKFMQQSCTMGPVRDDKGAVEYIFISVHDVTEAVNFEQKLFEMNMRDALTGINNRRCLEMHLKEEMDRHKRYGHSLSLIIFDIDFFKHINDAYGHQCGDYILKAIADSIEKSIRSEDIFARYGGEEFCCLLPETSLDAAVILAERFRKKISKKIHRYQGNQIKVTISLGVSTLGPGTSSPESLLKKADEGLYQAKNTGRNRVMTIE
jgi:diguanylate cyclase (GGDEF)-like protein